VNSGVPQPDSTDQADLEAVSTGMSTLLRMALRLMRSYDVSPVRNIMAVKIRTREPGDATPQCDGCNRNLFHEARLGPELHDATWLKLADKHAVICAECLFERAAECGVTLTLTDLRPCLPNVFRSPHSWYDLFLSRESDQRCRQISRPMISPSGIIFAND
jgi:hypothetical protein